MFPCSLSISNVRRQKLGWKNNKKRSNNTSIQSIARCSAKSYFYGSKSNSFLSSTTRGANRGMSTASIYHGQGEHSISIFINLLTILDSVLSFQHCKINAIGEQQQKTNINYWFVAASGNTFFSSFIFFHPSLLRASTISSNWMENIKCHSHTRRLVLR